MLKPSAEPGIPPPDDERPVGELVHELVEDGKAYAKAEIGLAKRIATAKANALKTPGILFFSALLLLQAAVNVLAVGVFFLLEPAIGALGGGLVAFLVFAAVAGGLAWLGVKKLREDL